MSALLSASPTATYDRADARVSHRTVVRRAVVALAWAAALILAIGDRVPSTSSDLPLVAAALLATYPLIDVIASLAATPSRIVQINAAISAAAAIAVGIAGFTSDAGAAIAAFGAWATVSGAIQLATAIRRRSAEGGQHAMLLSGGLSSVAGLNFAVASGKQDAHVAMLGGYMAVGAVLYLVSARRDRNSA